MEIPAAAILYALLLAATAGTLMYIYNLYDNAVYEINYAACQEVVALIKVALQRADYEIFNYTGYVELYYPVVLQYDDTKNLYLTIGRDTRRPAQCQLDLKGLSLKTPVEVFGGTGTRLVIIKQVMDYGSCEDVRLPALGKENGRFLVVEKCKPGIEMARYTIQIYLQ